MVLFLVYAELPGWCLMRPVLLLRGKNYVMGQRRRAVILETVLCQYHKGEQWPTAPAGLWFVG